MLLHLLRCSIHCLSSLGSRAIEKPPIPSFLPSGIGVSTRGAAEGTVLDALYMWAERQVCAFSKGQPACEAITTSVPYVSWGSGDGCAGCA